MPQNRVSYDLDHVPPNQQATKVSKAKPPELWSLPKYAPFRIVSAFGSSNLPPHIMAGNPYVIFTLIFDEEPLLSSLITTLSTPKYT